MKPDYEAPIVPGKSAAGILLGQKLAVSQVLPWQPRFTVEEIPVPRSPKGTHVSFSNESVSIYTYKGIITDITVMGQYCGLCCVAFTVNSPLADAAKLGRLYDTFDGDGFTGIEGIDGLEFETYPCYVDGKLIEDLEVLPTLGNACRVRWIRVFLPG